ncbi:MAG: helix-turn-helix domain-containing protein [Acidobacteria bacterium]|nr:helix-turn-helix domain-containing protein [Acidobacteriota bacterium]
MQQTILGLKRGARGAMAHTQSIHPTPLAAFVRGRLAELEISQSDFCRRSTFDQGLLSKIQNSLVTSLSIESVLKLAVGLSVPPQQLFQLIDRLDLHELVMQSYAQEFSAVVTDWLRGKSPELVTAAQRAITEASTATKSPVRPRRRRWSRENMNAANGSMEDPNAAPNDLPDDLNDEVEPGLS